jgi:hypothetical protein
MQLGVAPADEIGGPTGGRPTRPAFALSPDGKTLVFAVESAGAGYRPLDALTATLIPGTEDGVAPFFSPDGQSIASGIRADRMPLAGGPSVPPPPPAVIRRELGRRRCIVFAGSNGGLLDRLAAGGKSASSPSLSAEMRIQSSPASRVAWR